MNGSGDPPAERLSYSRSFAQAGFSVHESDHWRRAGWTDAVEAGRWKHLGTHHDPAVLRELAEAGIAVERVDRAVASGAALSDDELRARVIIDVDADDPDIEIDLRDRVLANLRRDGLRYREMRPGDQSIVDSPSRD